MDVFLTNFQFLALQDVNWWTGVVWITCGLLWCFYQLFGLSFWRHPFIAEDSLVSKWRNVQFLQIFYDEETNHLYPGCPQTFSADFHFWLNYSFNWQEIVLVKGKRLRDPIPTFL